MDITQRPDRLRNKHGRDTRRRHGHPSGSLFRAGLPVRLAAAIGLSCLLWAAIWWASA